MLVLSEGVSMDGWIGTGLLVGLRLCYGWTGQDRYDSFLCECGFSSSVQPGEEEVADEWVLAG
jgi:hypothetical protein